MTEPALCTFELEDPEGSALALRGWAGAMYSVEVGVEDASGNRVTLVSNSEKCTELAVGVRLVVVVKYNHWRSDRQAHSLRTLPKATHLRVRFGEQAIFVEGVPLIALHSEADPTSAWAYKEVVCLGTLPNSLPAEVEVLAVLNGTCEDLAPIANLHGLTTLDLSGCENLTDLAPIANLHALTSLHLSDCAQLTDLAPIANLHALTTIDLFGCRQLTDLAPIANLHALTTLNLPGCEKLTDLAPIANLQALTTLNLPGCEKLTDLAPVANLHALTTLDLSACDYLSNIAPIANLHALTSLNLSYCAQLTDLAPIANLHALTTLNLSGCKKLTDLAPIANLHALTALDLSGCKKLTDLAPIANLHALTALNLTRRAQFTDLAPIANLHALTALNLSGCTQFTDLAPIANLHALTALDLSYCTQLTDLAPIANLQVLTTLKLYGCGNLTDLAPLANLHALTELNLLSCVKLTDLAPLANLHGLTTLELTNCVRLTNVAPLAQHRSFTGLGLSECGNIRDLDTLSTLTTLRELTWTETAAPHAVLAATAVLRGNVDAVREAADEWLASVPLSKAPDVFGLRLVRAFALGGEARWAEAALTALATALRDRSRADDNPEIISAPTWAAWTAAVMRLGYGEKGALRAALTAALDSLDPKREIDPVLTPVLTALADVGPAAPRVNTQAEPSRAAPSWLLTTITEVLAPIAANADYARAAAPAAAVFYAGFGAEAEVRAWLDRGTHPKAPHWRDRVVLALLRRDVASSDPDLARRWFEQLATDEARDTARSVMAEAFAARLPVEAATELDAIGDDALRQAVATRLRYEPALLGTPAGLYAVVLALQDDPEALGDTLAALVAAHPESALVTALARDLMPEATGASAHAVLARIRALDLDALNGKAALDVLYALHAEVTV